MMVQPRDRRRDLFLLLPLLLLTGAARGSSAAAPPSRVALENRYDFIPAEVRAHDYMKTGLCPSGTKLDACAACYQRKVCGVAMVGFDARVGRADMRGCQRPAHWLLQERCE